MHLAGYVCPGVLPCDTMYRFGNPLCSVILHLLHSSPLCDRAWCVGDSVIPLLHVPFACVCVCVLAHFTAREYDVPLLSTFVSVLQIKSIRS